MRVEAREWDKGKDKDVIKFLIPWIISNILASNTHTYIYNWNLTNTYQIIFLPRKEKKIINMFFFILTSLYFWIKDRNSVNIKGETLFLFYHYYYFEFYWLKSKEQILENLWKRKYQYYYVLLFQFTLPHPWGFVDLSRSLYTMADTTSPTWRSTRKLTRSVLRFSINNSRL